VTVRLPFGGETVNRVIFDYALALEGSRDGLLRIERECEVAVDGARAVVDPARPGEHAALLVALLHRTVEGAVAEDDGTLRVRFSGGAALTVRPAEADEAWAFANAHGVVAVCHAGGRLVTWAEGLDGAGSGG
jgi:hypothetical protein